MYEKLIALGAIAVDTGKPQTLKGKDAEAVKLAFFEAVQAPLAKSKADKDQALELFQTVTVR